MPPPKKSEEFFYHDDHGKMADDELHLPIIASGERKLGLREPEPAVDEKMMQPIRDKHRARWLAERKRRAAGSA